MSRHNGFPRLLVTTLAVVVVVCGTRIDASFAQGRSQETPLHQKTLTKIRNRVIWETFVPLPNLSSAVALAPSPDNRKLAYVTVLDSRLALIIIDPKVATSNVTVFPKLQGIVSKSLAFSPNGNRVAFIGGLSDKRYVVVVDGTNGRDYDGIGKSGVIFSPDSRRIAYSAGAREGRDRFVVVDGQEHKSYAGIGTDSLIFSSDSKRFAYIAQAPDDRRWMVVVDGHEGKRYDEIRPRSLVFSPDNTQLAYAAQLGGKWLMIHSSKGVGSRKFDLITPPAFSPDGRRLAYAGQVGGQWILIVNEKERSLSGDEIVNIVFSPNSRRLAFVLRTGSKFALVIDGNATKKYDAIQDDPPFFSTDSKRISFCAILRGRSFRVIDEKDEGPYDAVDGGRFFSPDGRRGAYLAQRGGKWWAIVDGQGGKPYDGYVEGGRLVWDSASSFHYFALRGNNVYLVEENLE